MAHQDFFQLTFAKKTQPSRRVVVGDGAKVIDQRILKLIKSMGRLCDQQGVRGYIVGGFVRDALLKRKSLDVDFVVESNALHVAKLFARQCQGQLLVHEQFMTAALTLPDGLVVDIVSARRERYPKPGSLPLVERSDIIDDLFRRDFTVNAMAVVINCDQFGKMIDPFNGLDDLKKKYLRVMHQDSFVDDPTRLLRLMRYKARLNFNVESHTGDLAKQAAKQRVWMTVKPQRYMAEFRKLLNEGQSSVAIKGLLDFNALQMPVLSLYANPSTLKDIAQALHLSRHDADVEPAMMWLMGLQDQWRGDDLLFALEHLGLTRAHMQAIIDSLSIDALLGALSVKHVLRSTIYHRLKPLDRHVRWLLLAKARGLAAQRINQFISFDKRFALMISGDDVKKLGVVEGVAIRRVLEHVSIKSIDNQVLTKSGQFALARAFVGASC